MFRLWAQGLVKILKLKFRQDLQLGSGQFFLLMFCRGYEVESWSRFWSLSFIERVMFGRDFEVDDWSRFWKWNLIKICAWTCDMNSTLGSVALCLTFYAMPTKRFCPERFDIQEYFTLLKWDLSFNISTNELFQFQSSNTRMCTFYIFWFLSSSIEIYAL